MSAQKIKKLSLLTFNTLGTPVFAPNISKRYRRAAHLINIGYFDIVCLQEIFTYYHLYIFKTILNNFPYVVYQKNVPGPRGGLVIFSKYKLVHPQFVTFSYPQNATVPFYVKLARQGILTAELEGSFIQIITTHLSSDTTSYLTQQDKLYILIKNESEEVSTVVNRFLHKKKTVILAGDFNIAKHTELYTTFLQKTKLSDVFEKDEVPTYYPDRVSYFYTAPKARIDYIFVKSARKNIKILKTDTAFMEAETLSDGQKSFLSDHIGLHCILEVNE
jgi:endonuclease/exonuclease/phosphatase family metal-dependent hydrolase